MYGHEDIKRAIALAMFGGDAKDPGKNMVYVLLINMTSFSGASCVLFSFVTVIFIALSPASLWFLHNNISNLELQIQQGFFHL